LDIANVDVVKKPHWLHRQTQLRAILKESHEGFEQDIRGALVMNIGNGKGGDILIRRVIF
jgi:predicted helicase